MTNDLTRKLEASTILYWYATKRYSIRRIQELMPHRTQADIRALVHGVKRQKQARATETEPCRNID